MDDSTFLTSARKESSRSTGRNDFLLVREDGSSVRVEAADLTALRRATTSVRVQDYPHLTITDAVVVDGVHPSTPGTFRRVQAMLLALTERHVPIIWLLPAPTLRDEVQAKVAGASAVGDTAMSLVELNTLHIRLISSEERQRQADHECRMQSATSDVISVVAKLLGSSSGSTLGNVAAAAENFLDTAIKLPSIRPWMSVLIAEHEPTFRHSILVANIVAAFSLKLGLDPKSARYLVQAAALHDIGKALVPLSILNKPLPLDALEIADLRRHPVSGEEMLRVQGGHQPATLKMVKHHHELLDGSGYPSALLKEQIPVDVRIVTICDIFAALVETRAYKPSLSAQDAFALMRPMKNKLDLTLLDEFERLFFRNIS